ncbi:Uncharacterised protein [Mycobacteroides abscessus subsp. abscessus]|nr:Uncharacterised protein [Mycobacteroides abscessus subsp. abscessus]
MEGVRAYVAPEAVETVLGMCSARSDHLEDSAVDVEGGDQFAAVLGGERIALVPHRLQQMGRFAGSGVGALQCDGEFTIGAQDVGILGCLLNPGRCPWPGLSAGVLPGGVECAVRDP